MTTPAPKKSKNPFINLVNEANAAKHVPVTDETKLELTVPKAAKLKNQVQINKPTKRSAGRGR